MSIQNFKPSHNYKEYYKEAKNPILLKLLEEFYLLLNSAKQEEDEKIEKIETVIKYVDREFKKKFGEDEMFTGFPPTASTIISLTSFKKRKKLTNKTFKDFGYWLINNPKLRKKLGRKINVYDLCRDDLYRLYEKENDLGEVNIVKHKEMHSKRILKIDEDSTL